MRVKTERGKTFEAFQWMGQKDELPAWLANNEVELHQHHGPLLHVGNYLVRVTSWVLRSDERGDTFPVPATMFADSYTEVTD